STATTHSYKALRNWDQSEPERAILLFKRLVEHGPLSLNPRCGSFFFFFPTVLKACAKIPAFSEGAQVHGIAVKLGVASDSYVQNALIGLYFGCGRSGDAHLLFEKMPERSAVSWSCVIGGYAELGLWEKVKSLFRTMVGEFRVAPNSVTLVRVVAACTKSRDFELGTKVRRYICEKGVSLGLNLGNGLVNMYAKMGVMEEAERLFRRMIERDVVTWTTLLAGYAAVRRIETAREVFDKMPHRNVVAWNAMLSGYVSNGCFEAAMLLYNEMLVLDVKPDKATMISVVSASARLGYVSIGKVIHGYICKAEMDKSLDLLHSILGLYTSCGDMNSAESLFNKLVIKSEISRTLMVVGHVKHGAVATALETFKQMPYKDIAAWNAMISALTKSGYFSEALGIFEEMQRMKVSPNQLTLVSTLTACAKVGALELGRWIHAYIERNKIEMDAQLGSSLVEMYAKCGCIDLALKVFNRMHVKDLLAWTTIISGLAMHGRSKLALEHFKDMEGNGIHPDAVTFIGVLAACSHGGLVEEGKHYFDLMTRRYGIHPTTEHYSCMVDLFGRGGLLNEAKHFIESMDFSANRKAIWGALLGACNLHGHIELAEYVTRKLIGDDPTHCGAYVLMSNVYAKESMWDGVKKMRNLMKREGVEKVPGCSWIELNGVVHEFFAGGAYHPECTEIDMK
ncbi:Pentatricopeptide repeat-containing protein, partial [Ananas comosus]